MARLLSNCRKILKLYTDFAIISYGRTSDLVVYKLNRGYVLITTQYTNNSGTCSIHVKRQQSTSSNDTVAFQKHLEYKILTLFGEFKSGKVSVHILEELVNVFERTDYQLHNSLSILLLKCCGSVLPDVSPFERQAIADRIWKMLHQRKIPLTEEHYNSHLMILQENSQVLDPKAFLESMTVDPTKETYDRLLNVIAKTRNYRSVEDLLTIMRKKGFPVEHVQYNALVYVHAVNGNMTDAEKVIESMKSACVMPTSETYIQLALGYAKLGDISNILKILEDKECTISSILELVRNLILIDRKVHIPDVLRSIKQPLKGSESLITNAIIQCMYEKCIEGAYTILENVPANDEEIETFVNLFLKEMTKCNFPIETVSKYVETITAAKYIPDVLLKTVEYSLRNGNQSLTLKLFELMKSKNMLIRTHYYWPLIVSACKSGDASAMYPIIKHMVAMNVKVNVQTLYEYVFPHISTRNPIIALNRVKETGILTSDAVTALLMILLDNNNLIGAMELCSYTRANIKYEHILKKLVKAYYASEDIDFCIHVLLNRSKSGHKYAIQFLSNLLLCNNDIKDKDAVAVIKFLGAMKVQKVEVPKVIKTTIQQTVNDTTLNEDKKNIIWESFKQIAMDESSEDSRSNSSNHSQYMNITKLSAHIAELNAKGMNTRGALRKLFVLACKENDLQQVEDVMREYNFNNFKWTPGMKSFLFQFYVKMGMKDEAKKLLSEIKRSYSKMKIDSFKIVDYATVLVKHGEVDEAFSIVQENESVNEKMNLTRNCWALLTSIAHSNDFHRVHDMLQVLVKNKYCKVNNELLGAIVRTALERSDIETTIEVFKKCVTEYRKAPLQQEIMTKIVKEADNSNLLNSSSIAKILSLIKRVHNDRSAIAILIVALSECDKTDILQNVLSKNMDIPIDLLVHHLESLPVSKRLAPARVLLNACQNLQKQSLESLYESILFIHSQLGDCLGATLLWTGMEARNVKPTKKFRDCFVQLLTSHKFPLPPKMIINSSSNYLRQCDQ